VAKTYRVQQFAALAGVTVKTLHHYDRLGLLCPQRTASGYRVYADADLRRLAQITALKLVGVPLKGIAPLLKGGSSTLDEVLRSQREVLMLKRQSLDRAIEAIDEAGRRRQAGGSADADILRALIEAIEMQNNDSALKVFFDEEVFVRWRSDHPDWPGPDWHSLLGEVERSLDTDPASPAAQALLERWNSLVEADIGKDPAVRRAFTTAWHKWATKPETRPPLFDAYDTDRILRFIVNAIGAMAMARARQSPEGRVPQRVSPSRLRLFNEARALLGTDPGSCPGRDLGCRMRALLRDEFGDDQELLDNLKRNWKRRRSWPEAVVEFVASTYEVDVPTWQAVADYLDAAMEAAG
jgi:DNA-binding transcriptional MerR regulator